MKNLKVYVLIAAVFAAFCLCSCGNPNGAGAGPSVGSVYRLSRYISDGVDMTSSCDGMTLTFKAGNKYTLNMTGIDESHTFDYTIDTTARKLYIKDSPSVITYSADLKTLVQTVTMTINGGETYTETATYVLVE